MPLETKRLEAPPPSDSVSAQSCHQSCPSLGRVASATAVTEDTHGSCSQDAHRRLAMGHRFVMIAEINIPPSPVDLAGCQRRPSSDMMAVRCGHQSPDCFRNVFLTWAPLRVTSPNPKESRGLSNSRYLYFAGDQTSVLYTRFL